MRKKWKRSDLPDIFTDEGVKGYSFDQCVEDYRLNLLITMITPIAICGTLDAGNERGMSLEVILVRCWMRLKSWIVRLC